MTDTQADLTERASAEIKRWAGRVPNGPLVATLLDSDTLFYLAPMLAAFAQSEREAAAAEARRALAGLLLLADKAKAMAHRSPGYVGVSMAVDELHNAIAALASPQRWPALGSSLPPAPQEETR